MISGCKKKMYYVKGMGSSRFSEAYFVLRAGADCSFSENDLAAEADRIIRQHFPSGKRRWRRPKHFTAIMFAVGVITGAALMKLILA